MIRRPWHNTKLWFKFSDSRARCSAARGTRRTHVGHGIDRPAVQPDLKMAMRAGRATGRADLGDNLPDMDARTDLDQVARVVRVTGHVAIAMVDFDDIAIAVAHTRIGHHALVDGLDIAAQRHVEIDAKMDRLAAGDRIGARAIARGDI